MTTTTADTPKPAIIAASTDNDVVRAIANDTGLRAAVVNMFGALLAGDTALLQTRTFWAAIITPIVGALAARYAAGLDGATVGAITTVMVSAAMIGMRTLTTKPVTGIVTPASQTAQGTQP